MDTCGACQYWGADPPMNGGSCTICERSRADILATHGMVELSDEQKSECVAQAHEDNPWVWPLALIANR